MRLRGAGQPLEVAPRRVADSGGTSPAGPSRWFLATVMTGTLLNPLNSSMIAVALLRLRADFGVSVAAASWLISGFYLAASVGQPLMGRLADQLGPRRIFCAGLALVAVTGALAPFSPSFGWLVVMRVMQALGTSAAYPAGLAMIRVASGDPLGRAPAGALGALTIASSVSAGLGPPLGGFLVALAGWPAIFVVNVPIAVVGLALAPRWLPSDNTRAGVAPAQRLSPWYVLRLADLPGVLFFTAALAALLAFLLSLSGQPQWWLLPAAPIGAGLLIWRERCVAEPFLNVRMLAANGRLTGVFAQFIAVNAVFYCVFFGLPLWLEQARRFDPGAAGLLLLPISGLGVLVTPLAARLLRRTGPRPTLIIGAAALTLGSLLLLVLQASTPVMVILAVAAVLGIPNGFNNLGLQAALYEAAPPEQTGAAGGLFQTCRYTGAILATSLLGIVFATSVSSAGLHAVAGVMAILSVLLVLASVVSRR